MSALDDIFSEYVRMRTNGLDTRETLRALRTYIEPLPPGDRESLAQRLRTHEKDLKNASTNTGLSSLKPADTPVPTPTDSAFAWVECPNCQSRNRKSEIFCYSCGHLLETEQGVFDTRHFADATAELFSADYYGPESMLILESRDAGQPVIQIRPQLRSHELVVGRSSDSSAMSPDIDLAEVDGAEKGVSRLHLSLKYESADNAIHVYDLGSSNGSYVNGQKLHPKELRVLRSGDDLRLGRLVLRVRFSHPGEEIS